MSATYEYDIMDKLTTIIWTNQSGPVMALNYQYDTIGQITNITSSKGNQSAYAYDDFNRLTREEQYTTTGDKIIDNTYTYDPSGNRLSKSSLWGTVNYSYGTGNRLTTWNCENATNIPEME